jgi:transcriptional regulator with XRE-family HTH domain
MNTEQAAKYRSILGQFLRAYRRENQWTRLEFSKRLGVKLSLQTLATYELGTRHFSVVRLIELSEALKRDPSELLKVVHQRASAEFMAVDLDRIIANDEPSLHPLRQWAERRRDTFVGGPRQVFLNVVALPPLATLCGVAQSELVVRLREFAPESMTSRVYSAPATPEDD